MLELARRKSTYFWRAFQVAVLLMILWAIGADHPMYELPEYSFSLIVVGANMFTAVSIVTAGILAMTGLGYGSHAVAREVSARTLPVVVATPLGPEGFVWGKWKAGMGYLLFLLMGAVPALSIPVYLGAVSVEGPAQVGLIAATAGGLSLSIGLFCSTFARSGAAAFVPAVIGLAGYVFLPLVALGLLVEARIVGDWITAFTWFNPVATLAEILHPTSLGGRLVGPFWLGSSAVQLGLAVWLNVATSRRVARLAAGEERIRPVSQFRMSSWSLPVPFLRRGRVWQGLPLVWKELWARRRARWPKWVWAASLVGGLIILTVRKGEADDWAEVLVAIAGGLLLVATAAAAAGGFAKEREEGKWDLLRTLPIGPGQFVLAKMAGVFHQTAHLRATLLFLYGCLLLRFPRQFPQTLPYLFALFAFFLLTASVGLLSSLGQRNSRRAFAWTLGFQLAALAGFPLLLEFLGLSWWVQRPLLAATNPFFYLEYVGTLPYRRELQEAVGFSTLISGAVLISGFLVWILMRRLRLEAWEPG